jgi:hypothetical protein
MAKEKAETEVSNDVLAAALLKIAEMAQQPRDGGLTAEQLAEVLEGNAQATRKALRPEIEHHPDVSAFNPKGERDYPRPQLNNKVIFCGMTLERDELTLGEIELFNKFTHSCVARNGAWKAELKPGVKGAKGELVISIPVASADDRMDLPNGISLILTELLGGTKAVDPASLAERVAELEKEIQATKVA